MDEASYQKGFDEGRIVGRNDPRPVTDCVTNRENDKQPCGHPVACIVSSDEGTAHCAWCEEVAAARAGGYAAGVAEERERIQRWPIFDDKLIEIQKRVNPRLRELGGTDSAVSISQIREVLRVANAVRSVGDES